MPNLVTYLDHTYVFEWFAVSVAPKMDTKKDIKRLDHMPKIW